MANPGSVTQRISLGEGERVIILVSCRACGCAFREPRVVRSGNEGRCGACEETAATFRASIGELETQV